MKLHKLTLQDKDFFNRFLKKSSHELSVYAFENIYIWKGIFDIYWVIIEDSLCVFFQDKIGCFLYLAHLGEKIKPVVIEELFRIMDSFNQRKYISRIENVEEKNLVFYQNLGYECKYKSCDYLCKSTDLVQLQGNRFKSKRNTFNFFLKHYQFEYLPFTLKDRDACLKLYRHWSKQRINTIKDSVYRGMLKDNLCCLKILLRYYQDLGIVGRVVKIDREIKAFSFGYEIDKEIFCILYEITDLAIKGLAQFIFRQFSMELKDYPYINIMDDSGLENLKKVKLSYHPIKLAPAYIVKRKDGPR